ncbi:MAG TPA: NUDIX domain-containing protein [Candidatus Saccharimonadales bacterium]|nr:NUDIX domain-containing protein [Candidatus Saccharimonadales bacterium]
MKHATKIVCVDLDGTVCNDGYRHYLTPQLDKTHTWTDYHLACANDPPLRGTIVALEALAKQYGIYIVSGREEIAREATVAWLKKYKIPCDELHLRKPKDARLRKHDYKIKYLESLRTQGLEPVLFLEDWPMIANHIEAVGVPVLCVESRFPKLYDLPALQGVPAGSTQYPPLSQSHISDIAKRLAGVHLPGYPPAYQRLFLHVPGVQVSNGSVTVPDGPWHITDHPNRHGVHRKLLDVEVLGPHTTQAQPGDSAAWRKKGLATDQLGRPLHPHWRQLLGDPRIGLPTGIGLFYRYGPNPMVDSIVYRWNGKTPEFLLIHQKNSGKWGLPGGFIDSTDASAEAAARRELYEESGLDISASNSEIVWHGLPLRSRDTLHAWAEVTVVLFHSSPNALHAALLSAGDDADKVRWVSQSAAAGLDLFDTHAAYLALALPRLRPPLTAPPVRFEPTKETYEATPYRA